MKKITTCFLLAFTACTLISANVGPLSPLSDSWKEHAQQRFSEMFRDETTLALVCAPSFNTKIEYGYSQTNLIFLTQENGQNLIHLRDIYEDAERNFSFVISERDTLRLKSFVASALETVEPSDWSGVDGTPYIIRAKDAENEFGYTWSPPSFTYSNDITRVIHMLREDCIRSIGGDFFLSPGTEDFLRIVELTSDSTREDYIKRYQSLNHKPHNSVDPFAKLTDEQMKEKIMSRYLLSQLNLLYAYERKQMLTNQDSQ